MGDRVGDGEVVQRESGRLHWSAGRWGSKEARGRAIPGRPHWAGRQAGELVTVQGLT